MEEAADFSEADKSTLMDESDDSGIIPGSHSENALRASEEEEGEGDKAQRYPGPTPGRALPHVYRGLTSLYLPGSQPPVRTQPLHVALSQDPLLIVGNMETTGGKSVAPKPQLPSYPGMLPVAPEAVGISRM